MQNIQSFFQQLYQDFNARNIDAVLDIVTDDVIWANGMEGGHVEGRDAVRSYWTRQFTQVSAQVTPQQIEEKNNQVNIKVHQVVHDLNDQLLADEIVYHHFKLKNGLIFRFDIGEKTGL